MAIKTQATPIFSRTLFEGGFAGHDFDQALIERNATNRRRLEGPACDSVPCWVRLIHGANEDVLPIGGRTVGNVRFEFSGLFNIAPGANAFLDGDPIEEDQLLGHGETLEFIQEWGRKGMEEVWTKEEFCSLFKIGETDFATMVSKGLPVHHMEDDSIRITETQVDEFLDQQAGKGGRHLTASPALLPTDISPLIVHVRRIADVLDPPLPDIVDSTYVAGRPALLKAAPTPPEGVGALPDPHTIPQVGAGEGGRSPYLEAQQAAAYLGISLKSLYGIVERGHLKPLRGPRRRYRLTREMLDDYLGRGRAR